MADDEEVKNKQERKTRQPAKKKTEDSFRLMGRCLGEIVSGGIVAAGVMITASGLGWLADSLENHVHKTDFGHMVFDLVDKAGIVLDATLWLLLVTLSLWRLTRDLWKL